MSTKTDKTPAKGKGKTKTTVTAPRVTKTSQAAEIYREVIVNGGGARKDAIARFTSELGLSKAGASTYYQNAKKAFASAETPEADTAADSTDSE